MMKAASKRRGRPPSPPVAGERISLGLKVTAEIKKRLDGAARESGRTQSQEAEYRLQRSFDLEDLLADVLALAYGRQAAGVIMMLSFAMDAAGRGASSVRTVTGGSDWINDPHAFDQAVKAALSIFEVIRPEGESRPEQYKHMDDEAATDFLRYDDERVRSIVIDQVWMLKGRPWRGWDPRFAERAGEIRAMLGPVIDRLKPPPLSEEMTAYDREIGKAEGKKKNPKKGGLKSTVR